MKTNIIFLLFTLFTSNIVYSKDDEFEQFYIKFLDTLKNRDKILFKELMYFANEEEKEYFDMEQIFDSTIVDNLMRYDIKNVKKLKRKKTSSEDDPFNILEIPLEIKEIILIKLKTYYIENDEKVELINYFIFGKYKGKYLFLGSYIEG